MRGGWEGFQRALRGTRPRSPSQSLSIPPRQGHPRQTQMRRAPKVMSRPLGKSMARTKATRPGFAGGLFNSDGFVPGQKGSWRLPENKRLGKRRKRQGSCWQATLVTLLALPGELLKGVQLYACALCFRVTTFHLGAFSGAHGDIRGGLPGTISDPACSCVLHFVIFLSFVACSQY